MSLLEDGTYEMEWRDDHELTVESDRGHIAKQLTIWLAARHYPGKPTRNPARTIRNSNHGLLHHHRWQLMDPRRQRRHLRHPPGPPRAAPGSRASGGCASSPRHLAPGPATALAVGPGRPDDTPGHPAVEIAIYPDVAGLAARSRGARPGALP